ncbi:MAG: GldM family protein [Bacteroidota bacterium]
MKKNIIFILLITISTSAFTQKVIMKSYKDLLFVGARNNISFTVDNAIYDSLKINSSSGIIKNGRDKFSYYISNLEKGIININVSVYNKGNLILKETIIKRVVNIYGFRASILLEEGGEITKEKLLNAKKIDSRLVNADINVPSEIVSYSVIILKKNNVILEKTIGSNLISTEIINNIENLNIGDKIIFYNIVTYPIDGIKRKINSIVFEIK